MEDKRLPERVLISRFAALKDVAILADTTDVTVYCFLNNKEIFYTWNEKHWDIIGSPVVPNAAIGLVLSFHLADLDIRITISFDSVLILPAFYYLAVAYLIHMVPNKLYGFLKGSLFGIPLAIYLVSSIDDTIEYFKSSRVCLLFSSPLCINARLISVVYDISNFIDLLFIPLLFFIGFFYVLKVLKKVIYDFIEVNCIYIIIKQLIGGLPCSLSLGSLMNWAMISRSR